MRYIVFVCCIFIFSAIDAQLAQITVDVNAKGAAVSPSLHGIFFEEISHGGEGGLYGELIHNRGFEECRVPQGCRLDSGFLITKKSPHYDNHSIVIDWKMPWELTSDYPAWSLKTTGKAKAAISVVTDNPLNEFTPNSLKIDIQNISKNEKVAVVNEGFWGIGVKKDENYLFSFYVRTPNKSITVSLESDNGNVLAFYSFDKIKKQGWQKLQCTLKASSSCPSAKLYLSFNEKGTSWIDFVSLFPEKTFKNRPNGLRADLAQYIADLKPAFMRWPGGCYVEGINLASAPDWKRTLGPVEKRPGTYSVWGYWSTDGLGYHEFLQYCEDINAKALYVFNCGVSCEMRAGTYAPDDSIQSYIDDALNAIEYAIGPVTSTWGAVRAKNGHPQPFPLQYVEVGNEQWGANYGRRFNVFYKAIKAKYPQIEVMASMGISHIDKRILDVIDKTDYVDEHTYKSIYWPMIYNDWYDKYKRENWKMYIGEYACNGGVGKGNMMAALNDATSCMMFERNSDMIKMTSYAPLLVNENKPNWDVNLIHFNSGNSFARISYYAIKMMNENKATVNVNTRVSISDNAPKVPLFEGKIGLSTWDTYSEFKDINVIKNGDTLYKADFIHHADEWATEGGKWLVKDSALAQTTDGAWPMAVLKNKTFDTYTLKLKARRTGGTNAFMIPIAIKDNQNYMRAHIGAWVNAVAAFELVTNGTEAMVTQPARLEKPIENNRWYDVEIKVDKANIECYLDGKLLMTYTNPRRFFSIAGRDEATGEIVVKVVNANPYSCKTSIALNSANVVPEGKIITLSAESAEAENSLEKPTQYIPQVSVYNEFSSSFEYSFSPMSITIFRIKEKQTN